MARRRGIRFWLFAAGLGFVVLAVAALAIWRDDILEAMLDPQIPYAVYRPPPAPDYAKPSDWAMLAGPSGAESQSVDVFFVHPTTFDGGRNWNGSAVDHHAQLLFTRVMAPNYAAPFASVGRVFAPRYRQASLYTSLTVFDDAIEARQFAYGDVLAAFKMFVGRLNQGRPFILVGVEQGGALAARLLSDEIAQDPALRRRLVAAYLIETVVVADAYGPGAPVPACRRRDQSGCLIAWISGPRTDFGRSIRILTRSKVWNDHGRLVSLAGRNVLCVNPLLGAETEESAPERLNLGAANATGLEWGARPGFMVRQVGAQCVGGLLRVTRPRSTSLLPAGDWAQRLRAPGYNLFWADLEADSRARTTAWFDARSTLNRPD
jgi:hypothetical protein